MNSDEQLKVKLLPEKVYTYSATQNLDTSQKEAVQSMDKICAIQACFNHNLSLTSEGKVLTWGYSGFNILGRKPKQLFNNLPLQIFSDFRAEKQGLFQSQHSVNVA